MLQVKINDWFSNEDQQNPTGVFEEQTYVIFGQKVLISALLAVKIGTLITSR